jgi:prevent-host-death family protein
MARYSIAEARNNLPELVDKALAGEEVTLTREGEAVVELRPSAPRRTPRPLGEAEWRRLRARRAARPSLGEDSVAVVRAMRDGEP